MRLGIIGLPLAGKTTIFNALTRGTAPTGQSMGGRFDVLTAAVDVPDIRVDRLSRLYRPKKTTYARVIYNDIAGIQQGAAEAVGLSPAVKNHLAGMDGFVHVVRAFESDLVPHPDGSVDPVRDLKTLEVEMLLSDLVTVEGKIERLEDGLKKGAFKNKNAAQSELVLFQRLHTGLIEEQPLRALELSDEEDKSLRGYGFLTMKPVLVLVNLDDDQAEVSLDYEAPYSVTTQLRGKLEMELAQMDGEDLAMFMEEYGVEELGLDRIIHLSYELMGLRSFFTVGEDEVRAWALGRGGSALDAAGTIHSDLAKGFIRAEVVPHSDLLALGGLNEARTAGQLRLEGKGYEVQDGDIVHIKFNI